MPKCIKMWSVGPSTSQGGQKTGMDTLEFRGMEHPARNNEMLSICVKSVPYGAARAVSQIVQSHKQTKHEGVKYTYNQVSWKKGLNKSTYYKGLIYSCNQ